MTDMGFPGDPGHEGGSKPMEGLKGDMGPVFTQMPMDSTAETNPRSAAADNVGAKWDSTSLDHAHPTTGNNDARKPS